MFPETPEGITRGEGGGAAPEGPDRSGEEKADNGAPRVVPVTLVEGAPGGDGEEDTIGDLPEVDDDCGEGGGAPRKGHKKPNRTTIPRRDFIRVVRECNGNANQAARVLGLHKKSVQDRIEKLPELRAFYTNRGANAIVPDAPGEGATLMRSTEELPPEIPAADLGKMVADTEKILLNGGLEKLGVPKETIAKLRDLSSLNIDAGGMLAVSLQHTHQLYYFRLLDLDARLAQIRKKYLDEDSPDAQALEPMERMFWQRAYNEGVEQSGKGWDRMMAGTQAMFAMLKGKEGKGAGSNPIKNATPGWGPKR